MRVYDFDKTIYDGQVGREFYWFCLKRSPGLLRFLPGQLWALLCYWFGAKSQTECWQAFYRYFCALGEVEALAGQYWQQRQGRIKAAYLAVHQPGNLVLTSLPECLVRPACQALHLELLGSEVDPKSGTFHGPLCAGAEKLRRFRERFPQGHIEVFWSSCLSDRPVAMQARERRIVRRERVLDWEAYEMREGKKHRWLRTWISPEFFRFWCVGWLNLIATWGLEASWSLVLPPNLAFVVGYLMGLLVSFVLNSKITFGVPMTLYRLGFFFLSYIPNFIVQNLAVLVSHNWMGVPPLLSFVIAAAVGTPVTFLCLKFFAYGKKEEKNG